MRIVIDLQGAQSQSRFRGIGRYSLSLTKALLALDSPHEFLVVANGLFPDNIQPLYDELKAHIPKDNFLLWHAPGPVTYSDPENSWRRQVAELLREAFIESLEPDMVYISSFLEGYEENAVTSIGRFDRETPVAVSHYDLITLTNPKQYLDPFPLFKKFYLNQIEELKKASLLLAISDHCREECVTHLGVDDDKVVSISSAVDSSFHPAADYPGRARYFQKKFGIKRPYVLYTGGADDRKNLPRLIRVFAGLPAELRRAHQLVFAGRLLDYQISKLRRLAKSAGLAKDELILTGYISDKDLIQLYSQCRLYVFPSWHEGFGLPVLEAMACGAPVIGANASSLPEVIANDDAMFDPFSESDMTNTLVKALSDGRFREELRAHGDSQARRFSWENTAVRALAQFESVARGGRDHRSPETITGQLLQELARLPYRKPPTDLQLARIADCVAKNRASALACLSAAQGPQ
jgi:glycosyltransferase involved in cell wall biosynthesis